MATPNESLNPSSNKAPTIIDIIREPTGAVASDYPSFSPPSRARSPPQGSWGIGTEDGIPIPSALRGNDNSYRTAESDSFRTPFSAPNSWRTTSSWGGASILFHDDEVSLLGDRGDDSSDRESDVASVAGLSYARKRRLLRKMSKSSVSSAISRQGLHARKERWTKKLEDFREYESGIFTSFLPFKAGFAAALAASLAFFPFVPSVLTLYGTVAVLGVDFSLESNVGLTLQKGYNMMLGSALAGVCALVVTLIEPHTGSFRVYYLVICVFLGGCVPRCIQLPTIIKSRWAQTTGFYMGIFHGLILTEQIKMEYMAQFLINCLVWCMGFAIVLFLVLYVKPDYAGDALLVLLVSDFHTTGVVLERIVEDYKGGVVLTKIQEVLSGVVTEDHIHHDLQYIMKSTDQVEQLMNAAKWEPSHGKFFNGYPWDLYPTLLAMLLQVLYDLIALDSALRAEIQAPQEIRLLFADDMEIVARECSMLFHKVGDALFEHKKVDYHSNVRLAQLATINLRTKLHKQSASMIARDNLQLPSRRMTRSPSHQSIQEVHEEELPGEMSTEPTPPPSPVNSDREQVIEQDLETADKLNINEEDWKVRLFSRRRSVFDHLEETQQQMSSLSLIKFATILIELMGKVKGLVTMVDQISEKAHFSDATGQD